MAITVVSVTVWLTWLVFGFFSFYFTNLVVYLLSGSYTAATASAFIPCTLCIVVGTVRCTDITTFLWPTLRTKKGLLMWAGIALVTVIVVGVEWRYLPDAVDIVTYAKSYAAGHVEAYGRSLEWERALVWQSVQGNFVLPLTGLAFVPALLSLGAFVVTKSNAQG